MQNTLIQWASSWDGNVVWFAVLGLFVISGLIIIPRPAIGVLAGLTLGLAAFPLALVASVAGALIAFIFARYLFRERFVRIMSRHPKARVLTDAIDAEGWRLLFLLRLASPIPAPISNYAFGLSSIRLWPYALATAVGIAPQLFAFVYLGAVARVAIDDRSVSSTRLVFGVAGAAVLVLIVAMVTRRVRQSVRTKLTDAPQSH